MPEVSLVVTRSEFDHASTRPKERQIALRYPSPDIGGTLKTLNSSNRVHLTLGDFIMLEVADPGAVWLAHNEHHSRAFESLYAFLATNPDREMRFICSVSTIG
jgi:hypothetical protein